MRRKKRVSRKPVKPRVERTRNAASMTEAAFWQFIRSCLRQKSRWWKPILIVKMASRRLYRGPNRRQRYEYKCGECSNYFPDKQIQVHHKNPAGVLNCAEDLPGFVERLFCESEDLIVLCSSCHDKKHIKKTSKTKK